jgi:predicted glycoside hydrolase/deacetylase ChbG (UPF0249 family)
MIKKLYFLCCFYLSLLIPTLIFSQSVAQRLGFDKDSKLLIIHADDVGLSHSVNSATIKTFEKSGISSASIMVPCPWFPEIAAYAKQNPQYDFGLHLTLTAEWKNYRWGGVLSAKEIPSLMDEKGFFYATSGEVALKADPEEVEKELRAQIDRAIDFGVKPSHLDSHMGSLFTTPDLFQVYLKVGEAYNIPVFIPMNAIKNLPELLQYVDEDQISVDHFYMMESNRPSNEWTEFYQNIIGKLKPGLNEIIIHLAVDDREMQAVTIDHPDFGASWRQNDMNTFLSDEFKSTLAKNNIKIITWKEIKDLLNSEN